MKVAIFIPTYKRAGKIPEVIQNIVENTSGDYRIYFIVETDDSAALSMLEKLNMTPQTIFNNEDRCYAGAINTAYKKTTEDYFFTGADDLNFHKGWLEEALKAFEDPNIGVVGTNDMGTIPVGPERDSTHYLVSRAYIKKYSGRVDAEDTVLYPYIHNYTDKEFIETAKKRGMFKYAPQSLVEHMHWAWGKGQMDETYQKGLYANQRDHQTYMQRQHLWEDLP